MTRKINGPVVLVVLDGWGLREEKENNGVALAKTPWYDHLVKEYPFTTLIASGENVGLPEGQMGNSEVGHTTIGAGYVLYQDLVRITKDVENGNLEKIPAFTKVFDHVKSQGSKLHVMGILSPGGVHGHEDHLIATVHAAKKAGIDKIIIHPFLDGRDSAKNIGSNCLKKLETEISKYDNCVIASVMGRYYSMDRDTNWDRTKKAEEAIFSAVSENIYEEGTKASSVVNDLYSQEVFDEHIPPLVFKSGKKTILEKGDGIIFTNFRKDRAKQISLKICEKISDLDLEYVTMTNYGEEIKATVAYKPESIEETLGSTIAKAGLKQAHLAETEKFPHATYYLNGGRQTPYENEEDIMIPSRKDVKTHDEAPAMKAKEICDAAIEKLSTNDFLFINFANPDMVGHTANIPAIITAVEVVDNELERLTKETLKQDGALLIIADHGNAETMVDPETNQPHTAHTTNPVPCILVNNSYHPKLVENNKAGLKDVAPTILELLGVEKPKTMTGESIISETI